MAMSDEGTHVLLSRTLETLLESPRGCCLCWQHGQKVFPKLKCRADSLFGRAIKNSLFLFYPNNFFFLFFPLLLLKELCSFITLSSVAWERQKTQHDRSIFLRVESLPRASAYWWNPTPQRTTHLTHAKTISWKIALNSLLRNSQNIK